MPFIGVEKPAAENLFGSVALVAGFSVQFGSEILGERLQRTDTSLVHHIHLSHFVGALLRQRTGFIGHLRRLECAHCQQYNQRRHLASHLLQQQTELALSVEKQPHHGDEEQDVAYVSHAHAPRVMRHRQHRIAFLVVVALVETIVTVFQNVIHRNGGIRNRSVVGDLEVAHEVHRRMGAWVGLNLEMTECQRERKTFRVLISMFFNRKLVSGDTWFQRHLAVLPSEHRQQRTQQNLQNGAVH